MTGRVPLLLALGVLAVAARPEPGTVWWWVLGVVAFAAADLALAPSPRSLELHRTAVAPVRLGESTASDLLVANPTRRQVLLTLRDAWQPSAGAQDATHRLDLGPEERAAVRTVLTPARRGDLQARGVTVRVIGPLRLAARQQTRVVPGRVRALPAFTSRRHLPSRLARLRELDGRAAVRTRGQGTEFDSLRGYVDGDDVRSIDWRASARSREVVVRTWQPERDRRVVLVLDTSRTSAGRVGDVPRLDSAMDAALLLAALATRAGDRVDLVAGDRVVRARWRDAGPRGTIAALEDRMADLEPLIAEADWATLAGAIAQLGRQRALLVLLTPLEPSAVEESLLPVLPGLLRHHRVVLASVRDPALHRLARSRASLDALFTAAAAERTLERRRSTAAMLATLGVQVIDAEASALPPALADHYLSLKAHGLL